jgi:Putative auto-transporter adhesin, head GIN domain
MKNSISILFAAIGLLFFTSCEKVVGEGPMVTQLRSISGFKGVSVGISGQVNYKIDPVYKVELIGQQNILDVLETRLSGDELIVKIRDGKRVKSHEAIVVNISGPFANWVNLSGSAEFNLTGNLVATSLDLRVSGSGNIRVQQAVVSEQLKATISGSGNIAILAGTGKNENLRVSGSGNIDIANLVAERGVVEISGSGNTKVHLTQVLDASISGSGSVLYRGTPAVSTHVSGSGSVRPL